MWLDELMSPISTEINSEILNTNLSFEQLLFSDRITIQTIIPVVSGIINISIENPLVLGKVVKKGNGNNIINLNTNFNLDVSQDDIVTLILFSNSENEYINYNIEYIEYLRNQGWSRDY